MWCDTMLISILVIFIQVEVNTVDQYQGRDKNVIIVSFVKSSVAKDGHVSIVNMHCYWIIQIYL